MKEIRFAVFSDLHYDHIHDGDKRIQSFVSKIRNEKLDFVIELGDFAHPVEDNKALLTKVKELEIPFYHALGNHDSDSYPRKVVLDFLDMKESHYSFSLFNTKFIILDSCYIKTDEGEYEAYFKKNYDKTSHSYPYIPEFQLNWLRNELSEDYEFFVIFSHHSLENDFQKRGISNRDEVHEIIKQANETDKRVLFCMNGHDHGEGVSKIGETYYYALNSMSYIWVGPQFEHFSYSEEEHKKYPYLKDLVLYEQGLFALVRICENGDFEIQGMNGQYQNTTPSELGLGDTWNGRSIKPLVSSLTAKYDI